MPCLFKPDMHHTWLCIMPWLCDGWLPCCLLLSGVLLRVGSDNVVLWGFVQLHPFVFSMASFFFLAGFQARWPYPRNHFYLCLLDCSHFCYAYATIPTTCLSCLPYCHAKPLTHLVLANRCLAMLPLCSAPLIALLVAGEDWSLFHVGTWIFVGISQYLLFN